MTKQDEFLAYLEKSLDNLVITRQSKELIEMLSEIIRIYKEIMEVE